MGQHVSIIAPVRIAAAASVAMPSSDTYSLNRLEKVELENACTQMPVGELDVRVYNPSVVIIPTAHNVLVKRAMRMEMAHIVYALQSQSPIDLNNFISSIGYTGAVTPALLVNLVSHTIDEYVSVADLTSDVSVTDIAGGVKITIKKPIHPAFISYASRSIGNTVVASYATRFIEIASRYPPAAHILRFILFRYEPVPWRSVVSTLMTMVALLLAAIIVTSAVAWHGWNEHGAAVHAVKLVESHSHVHPARGGAMLPLDTSDLELVKSRRLRNKR